MFFKILIVDDDYINRHVLTSFLKKELYQVEILEAVDGETALEICRENLDIKLIFLDLEMPNMNGETFLKHYIKDKELPKIPIIIVSSNDLRIKEILNLGADSFLVKPVTKEKLLTSLQESLTA